MSVSGGRDARSRSHGSSLLPFSIRPLFLHFWSSARLVLDLPALMIMYYIMPAWRIETSPISATPYSACAWAEYGGKIVYRLISGPAVTRLLYTPPPPAWPLGKVPDASDLIQALQVLEHLCDHKRWLGGTVIMGYCSEHPWTIGAVFLFTTVKLFH